MLIIRLFKGVFAVDLPSVAAYLSIPGLCQVAYNYFNIANMLIYDTNSTKNLQFRQIIFME